MQREQACRLAGEAERGGVGCTVVPLCISVGCGRCIVCCKECVVGHAILSTALLQSTASKAAFRSCFRYLFVALVACGTGREIKKQIRHGQGFCSSTRSICDSSHTHPTRSNKDTKRIHCTSPPFPFCIWGNARSPLFPHTSQVSASRVAAFDLCCCEAAESERSHNSQC